VSVTAQRFVVDGHDYILVTGINTEPMLERFIGTFLTWPMFRDPICLLLDLSDFHAWSDSARAAIDRAVTEFGVEGRWLGVLVGGAGRSGGANSEVDESAHLYASRARAVRAIKGLPTVLPDVSVPEQSRRLSTAPTPRPVRDANDLGSE
jgi:hypothetical protein